MKLHGMTSPARSFERTFSPPGALICSALYITAASLLHGPLPLLFAAVIVLTGQSIYLRKLGPAAFLGKVTLPVVLPLLAIHGILNPHFRADRYLWDFVPLRAAGTEFAAVISARLFLVAAAMAIWRYTNGSQVIGFFYRIGLPPALIAVVAMATSSIDIVQQKARAVFLAQQARGIDLRVTFASRVASLPKLVVPVAVATIVDSSERGAIMENRGVGSGPWRLQCWYLPPSTGTVIVEATTALLALAPLALAQ